MHSDAVPTLQHPPQIPAAQPADRAGGAVMLVVDFG
jgi:hypothetical protein